MISVFVRWKDILHEDVNVMDQASRIHFPDGCKLAIFRKIGNNVTIHPYNTIVNFFDVAVFLLSSLITGPSFVSILELVPELWQLSIIKDWPEIKKSRISPSGFCPITGVWGKPGISKLAQMSLIENLLNTAKFQGYRFWDLSPFLSY